MINQSARGNLLILSFLFLFLSCGSSLEQAEDDVPEDIPIEVPRADVVSVTVSGNENAYQFAVSIASPDTGCDQYANWWEVTTTSGDLVYRRILAHSHINEQPFIRSGGPVAIGSNQEVIIRAHMHDAGYGGAVYRGSVSSGFEAEALSGDFAAELATAEPLPTGCAG